MGWCSCEQGITLAGKEDSYQEILGEEMKSNRCQIMAGYMDLITHQISLIRVDFIHVVYVIAP
jgi:hypothetical protein